MTMPRGVSDRRDIPGVYSSADGHSRGGACPEAVAFIPARGGVLLVLVTAASCFLSDEAIRRVRLLRPLFRLDLN
jgi:hypothetical protein